MPNRLKHINDLVNGPTGMDAKGNYMIRRWDDTVPLIDALVKDVLKLQRRVKKLEKKVSGS